MKSDLKILLFILIVSKQSLGDSLNDCSSDDKQLTVKGDDVKISDVIKAKCWTTATHIEIFATNKVVFDAVVDKPAAFLGVFAPIWEVVSGKKIELKGTTGLDFDSPAKNGDKYALDKSAAYQLYQSLVGMTEADKLKEVHKKFNDPTLKFPYRGEDGEPGRVGGPGGQLFGFGKTSSGVLNIYANGGKGGKGQNGGNGMDGRNGLSFVLAVCGDCGFETIGPALPGTAGGRGGCGGEGGNPGLVDVFAMDSLDNIKRFLQRGEKGSDGQSGSGGKAAKVAYGPGTDPDMFPAGNDGDSSKNCHATSAESLKPYNTLESLNRYKIYLLEFIEQTSDTKRIREAFSFLVHLNNDRNVKLLYKSVLDFISEFEMIDSHYFALQKKISLGPYYESMRINLLNYSDNVTDTDELRAINHAYTTITSRLFAISAVGNNIAIVNLIGEAGTIRKKVRNLKDMQQTEYIDAYRNEYVGTLNQKITSAVELVNKMIVPKVSAAFKDVEFSTKQLLGEINDLKEQTKEEIKKAKEVRKKLKFRMGGHLILNVANCIGTIVSFLGPPGAAVGAGIKTATGLGRTAIDSLTNTKELQMPNTPEIMKRMSNIAKYAESDKELLRMQLDDLKRILEDNDLADIKQTMTEHINKASTEINNIKWNSVFPSDEDIKTVKNARNNLEKAILEVTQQGRYRRDTEASSFGSTEDGKSGKKKRLKQVISAGKAGYDIYKEARSDLNKVKEVSQIIEQLEEKTKLLQQHEEIIYDVMIPSFRSVESSLTQAVKDAVGQSHVKLDIGKWAIRTSLRKMKRLFGVMSEGFSVEPDLKYAVEEINDAMATIMDVYDRIDSYKEKTQFANLITNIANGFNEIKNSSLKDAVFRMEKIVRTNLVLEQYQMMINAVKNHKFPYGKAYMDMLELPTKLRPNSTELDGTITQKLDDLIESLSKHTLTTPGETKINNYPFKDKEAFTIWNSWNQTEILFRGETVVFLSDVNGASTLTAIKFKEIWLNFRMSNEEAQKRFNTLLNDFWIELKLVGNNYYRCDNRIYYIPLEYPIVLSHSYKDGQPTPIENDIFSIIKANDPFLSPFSTWQITMVSKDRKAREANHQKLIKFRDDFKEIAFEGKGEAMDNKEQHFEHICNEKLDPYYTFDGFERLPNQTFSF